MKNKILKMVTLLFLGITSQSLAHTMKHMTEPGEASHKNSVKAEIVMQQPLVKDNKTLTEIKLTSKKDNKPLLPSDIKEVHTEKIHLLIFDRTLTDYQHIHPTPTDKPGVYRFEWTPKKEDLYRMWVDITPLKKGRQEYAMVDLGALSKKALLIDKTLNSKATVDGFTFTLSFDPQELKKGQAAMGKVLVKDAHGQPVTQLEPVMGAFAHIVAISEDFKTIAHVHPLGKEPTKSSDRGGPELEFHIEPEKAGFLKIWVQLIIDGKEIYVPFGVNVK